MNKIIISVLCLNVVNWLSVCHEFGLNLGLKKNFINCKYFKLGLQENFNNINVGLYKILACYVTVYGSLLLLFELCAVVLRQLDQSLLIYSQKN